MNIPESEWSAACGGYVQDSAGGLWRIIGFIDRPTVILDPVEQDGRARQTVVMGSAISREYRRLIPEEALVSQPPARGGE